MAGITIGPIGQIDSAKVVPKRLQRCQARPHPRIELLVLQPTTFCNIACAYCYLPARHLKRRMTHTTLERAVRVVCGSPYVGEQLTIVWHAGEPMVLPVEYYRDAFAVITAAAPPALHITHSVQTNGLLLDEAWIDLTAEHNLRVGVSLDGPSRFHDAYRRTRTGRKHACSGASRYQTAAGGRTRLSRHYCTDSRCPHSAGRIRRLLH
jgi:sulfatase maturation enzyme AslB (radical SAM superfamily)